MDHLIKTLFFFKYIKDRSWKKWKGVSTLVKRKGNIEGDKTSFKLLGKKRENLFQSCNILSGSKLHPEKWGGISSLCRKNDGGTGQQGKQDLQLPQCMLGCIPI